MKIYKCNISDITENEFNTWFTLMSDERKAEVTRLVSEEKKREKIAADRLCRTAIADFCDKRTEDIIIKKYKNGKPYSENTSVNFSISHSSGVVVCAVSDKRIGVDIEKIRSVKPDIARKFATEKELGYIKEDAERLLEIWTLKEAYFKCIGTGLGADIKNISFEVENGKIRCSESGYDFSFESIENGFTCSVCVESIL